MKAIDTNVLLRLIVRDDPLQIEHAKAVVAQPFMLLPTVILEAVWVLQTRYNLEPARIVDELAKVMSLDTASTISKLAIQWAPERFNLGGDFADMLHIGLAAQTDASHFTTFDKRIERHVLNADIVIETLN